MPQFKYIFFFRILLLSASTAFLCVPQKAYAWTEARIQSVTADIFIEKNAKTKIDLQLKIEVRRGWLERIDLPGFSPVLEIDTETSPTLVDENLKWYPVKIEAPHSKLIQAFFYNKKKPKRGNYTLSFSFFTEIQTLSQTQAKERFPTAKKSLLNEEEKTVIHWLFPSWDNNLNNIIVRFHFPIKSDAEIIAFDPPTLVQTKKIIEKTPSNAQKIVLSYNRHHLPRTISWPLWMNVNPSFASPHLRTESSQSDKNTEEEKAADYPNPIENTLSDKTLDTQTLNKDTPHIPHSTPAKHQTERNISWQNIFSQIVILLLFFTSLSIFSFHNAAKAHFVKEKPFIPLSAWLRFLLAGGLTFLAIIQTRSSVALSAAMASLIPLLALQQKPTQSLFPRPGNWIDVSQDMLDVASKLKRTSRWISPTVVDATTILGATMLLGTFAYFYLVPLGSPFEGRESSETLWLMIALICIPFFTATQFHLPANPYTKLLRLDELTKQFPIHTDEINTPSLMVHIDMDQTLQDARLRMDLRNPLDGIEKIELLSFTEPSFGEKQTWTLSIICTPGSDAQKKMTGLIPTTAKIKKEKTLNKNLLKQKTSPTWIHHTKVLHGPNQKHAYFIQLTTENLSELPEIFSVIQKTM